MSFLDDLFTTATKLKTLTAEVDISSSDPTLDTVLQITSTNPLRATWQAGGNGSSVLGEDVSKYAPDKVLTYANFEAALRDAVTGVMASYDDTGLAARQIVVPPGNFLVDASNGPIIFPGTYGTHGFVNQGFSVGLQGAGRSSTVIFVTGSCAPGRGVFEWGIPGGSFPFGVMIRGVSIIHVSLESGIGSGIRFREQSFVTHLEDLYIRGFGGVQGPDDGWGVAFDHPSNPAWQHQHVSTNNVAIQGCQVGLKRASVAQYSDKQLHLTQNKWCSEQHTKALSGGTYTGTLQDSDSLSGARLDDTWYAGTLHPSTVGVPDTLVASGTGATLGVAVASTDPDTGLTVRRSPVSGLAGITREHVGMWLYLSNGETYEAGHIIRGVYQIDERTSSSALKILKGTNHPNTGSLTWEIRTHQACEMAWEGFPYHEGEKRCVHHVGPCSPATSERYVFNSVGAQNTMAVLVEGQLGGQIAVYDAFYSGTKAARINDCGDFRTNLDPSVYAMNEYTRAMLFKRGRTAVRARRVNTLVKEVGALGGFSFDATLPNTITIPSGTDVSEWKSAQDAAVKFQVNHATKYSTYVAADAGFGGPAISVPAGVVGANFKGLTCTIPSAKLPTEPYFPTLIVVARLANTTPDADVRLIRAVLADNTRSRDIGFHDGVYFPTGCYALAYSSTFGGTALAQPSDLVTATTSPVFVASGGSAEDNGLTGYFRAYSLTAKANYPSNYQDHMFAPGVDLTIQMPFENAGTTGELIVRRVIVVPHLISIDEIEMWRDMVATEDRLAR
jgi:hypothetical protein